ncbi:putative peroxisome biosynthesis protein (pas10 peroxin-12) protein [Neofusicoccum parvum UCRNP2]|uniref:Peroxisome assembly protein 12 n=1 Tax=Botryosphaeria parva (strain UCR-NP2) TaxID=1287680 RepID=R1EZA5_BOTPV|nr:putative peroxisome biosynthesis protein (pas10 peroxin-12) protein [Neofusicoccum parvum UCRNP2]
MEYMSSHHDGFDELKPSLFELLSEQQLSALLPPSLRYLLAVATHRHPRYLLPILNSFDEVYALLSLLVERHFLRTYGGGFTENFYGLKRERVLRVKGGEVPRAQQGAADAVRETLKLRNVDVWRNLAVMVGLPWLKRKLDEGWDIHAAHASVLQAAPAFGRERDGLPEGATIKQRIVFYYKWFLRKVYPSLNAAYYFALLAWNLAYLFDSSKFHSPFMWLVSTRIRRLNAADHRAIEHATTPIPAPSATSPRPGRPGQSNSVFHPRNLASTVSQRALSSLRILLPTSIFALKFLEWWHASDFARQLSRQTAADLELPPPIITGLPPAPSKPQPSSPTTPSKTATEKPSALKQQQPQRPSPPISSSTLLPILTVSAPSNSALCPICVSPIQTPTASPYGLVYCYACIHRWVDGTHERQAAFMEGNRAFTAGDGEEAAGGPPDDSGWAEEEGSREGRWECGEGRDAVTGRRVLGGTEALRRVVV